MSNYKFETLQLHVGQEQADPATAATTASPATTETGFLYWRICFTLVLMGFSPKANGAPNHLSSADSRTREREYPFLMSIPIFSSTFSSQELSMSASMPRTASHTNGLNQCRQRMTKAPCLIRISCRLIWILS